MNDVDVDVDVPPAGEEIHLPGPTALPLFNAVGISMIVIGTTVQFVFLIAGGLLFAVTTIMWIRDTRRDMNELPEEHLH